MKFNKYLLGMAVSAALAGNVASASQYVVNVDASNFTASGPAPVVQSKSGMYIVELKGAPAVSKATEIGELIPSNQLVAKFGNRYNPESPKIQAYIDAMTAMQSEVATDAGIDEVVYQYVHTFNGFSAELSAAQVEALRNHPDVSAIYQDEIHQLQTSNTPAFLGLTGEGGQHTLGIKGEDVIVGILDSGIWPENDSFQSNPQIEEMAYGPAPEGWAGACNVGSIGEFVDDEGVTVYSQQEDGSVLFADGTVLPADTFDCNDKLIGARYFGSTFSSVYEMQLGLGEFPSPRDADGHGSHTASTAAGNAGVSASLGGAEVGIVSGIAPRARVAAYKVCWNANYVSPDGVNERGCFFGDSLAAIDQAVVDGVDVLNYSIGNSQAINTPVYNASLSAADAGVFFAASAGNSGPGPDTVSNIAPWIATVAASTYDGTSAVIGTELNVNTGTLAPASLFAVDSAIGTPTPEGGLTADLGLASPILACEPLSNDLTGQIALIARGECAFTDKLNNAAAAGAIGAVVYTTGGAPFAMGGTPVDIPGVMIFNEDGLALVDSVNSSDIAVSVTLTNNAAATESIEVGNIMANFSSRGVNTQTADILKPDITAPGVRILAASSPEQLMFGGNPQGENFAYLQGTSMSSPHIAGVAALLAGQHPDWTPAQIKSAIMTTARQNLVKEDGETPTDPFDFGAGHVDPIPAMNPGIVYSANLGDYLGFLCGQGEAGLVASERFGSDCADIEAQGFATDASQLNYPSIAVGELDGTETITRTVTDVSGEGGTYSVVVDAPPGISVTVATFDANGTETESDLLELAPNDVASYSLTFTVEADVIPEQWAFGSVTLDGAAASARSPIAVFPLADVTISVPESLSLSLNRGRAFFFIEPFYTGRLSYELDGLVPASGISSTAISQPGEFDFGANLATSTFLTIPPGTSLMRFVLNDALVGDPAADIDLLLYRCEDFSCGLEASSQNGGSNEEILLVNPIPNDPSDPGALYILFGHGFDTNGADSVDYTVATWIANGAESTTRLRGTTRAVEGRLNNMILMTRGLDPDQLYMGTATFTDDNGDVQGTTVLEVQP